MDDIGTSLPELSKLIEQRLALLRSLAESLEGSTLALVRNDAEAIARGAAHQAELCRQWSRLEDELRREAGRRSEPPPSWRIRQFSGNRALRAAASRMGDARNSDPLSHARALVAVAAPRTQFGRPESRGRQLRAHLHARSRLASDGSPARIRRMCWRITMSGLFGSLSVALSGLSVSQQEMETTSNNVANANTPGYTREVSDVTAADPVEIGSLSVG